MDPKKQKILSQEWRQKKEEKRFFDLICVGMREYNCDDINTGLLRRILYIHFSIYVHA